MDERTCWICEDAIIDEDLDTLTDVDGSLVHRDCLFDDDRRDGADGRGTRFVRAADKLREIVAGALDGKAFGVAEISEALTRYARARAIETGDE